MKVKTVGTVWMTEAEDGLLFKVLKLAARRECEKGMGRRQRPKTRFLPHALRASRACIFRPSVEPADMFVVNRPIGKESLNRKEHSRAPETGGVIAAGRVECAMIRSLCRKYRVHGERHRGRQLARLDQV